MPPRNVHTNFLSRLQSPTTNTPFLRFFENATRITKRFLAELPELCILETDKGKKMGIIADYDTKTLELFNDSTILDETE